MIFVILSLKILFTCPPPKLEQIKKQIPYKTRQVFPIPLKRPLFKMKTMKLEKLHKMSTIYRHFINLPEITMKASIVDLRYKTKEVLKALERNESVTVLYHGKVKGVIRPVKEQSIIKVEDHPFFGMNPHSEQSVPEELENLRKPRHDL